MRRGIVAAGNWIADKVKTIDRWPGEGNLCNILSQRRGGGGGPCNVLFDLAAMKTDIPLFAAGKVGNDDDGDYLVRESGKRRIDTRFLLRDPERPTSYTDVMSGGGRRTFFHCRGANAGFGAEDIAKIDVQGKIFYLGYLLLLDSLDMPDDDFGTAGARALDRMRRRGFLNVVDFVSEAPEKFRRIVIAALPYIDVLAVNEIEAGCAFDLEIRRKDESLDFDAMRLAAKKFLDAGVGRLVVIHYPEGAFALDRSGEEFVRDSFPIAAEEIKGTVGAGDAFCAGVLYALHEELPAGEMLDIAGASARFNLTSPTASDGAVPLEKIREFLKNAR